ncbi:MAG TPA: pitrilysin family protein [Atribacteraceae bacterium]|nr:pitrilysin family protein [Atribacteraceae bacterium]
MVIPYSKTVFPSGLRVVHRRVASPLVALHVWIRSGVRHESRDQVGIAHYFEHMVFKGSHRYPGSQLCRQIQALGGTMNAGTSLDTTDFYLVVPHDFWQDAVPFMRELIWESSFDPVEMENEKMVVFQEMNIEEDDPEEKLSRILYETVFADTPYARPILGTEETIRTITGDDLIRYREQALHPANMVVVVAGNLPVEEVLSVVERDFAPPPAVDAAVLDSFPPLPERGGEKIEHGMDISMTYGALGYLCPGIKEDSGYALNLLAGILGEGIASRLNLRLREDKGLVDAIQAAYLPYEKAGLFCVIFSFLEGNTEQVEEAIHEEMIRVMAELPLPGEIQRAINLLKTAFYRAFETTLGNAEILGRLDSIDNIDRLSRYIPLMEGLQASDLREVLIRYLDWDRCHRIVVHPHRMKNQ